MIENACIVKRLPIESQVEFQNGIDSEGNIVSGDRVIVAPKQVVPISVEYTNSSDTAVSNVTVSVRVPDKMDYVVGSAEASGGVWNPSAGTVSWVLETLNASESGTKVFQARVQ